MDDGRQTMTVQLSWKGLLSSQLAEKKRAQKDKFKSSWHLLLYLEKNP